MRRVVLHIDRLVLLGFDPADGDVVADAVRSELARFLGDAPNAAAAAASGYRERVRAPQLKMARDASPAHTGALAGQAIGKAMTR
jgi:hypothetical protein